MLEIKYFIIRNNTYICHYKAKRKLQKKLKKK